MQRRWVGRWLIVVSVIHTLFALVVFGRVLRSLVERGLFNTVGKDPQVAAVAWFVLFGVVLFIAGLAVDALEAARVPLPRSLGWSLLALVALGLVLMPASGFWLALPPAVALLVRRSRPSLPEPMPGKVAAVQSPIGNK